jgi:MraZ protein
MTGKSEHTLDAKGRLILPVRLRKELGEAFYIAAGYHQDRDGTLIPNLTLYPMEAWNRISDQLNSLPEEESSVAEAFFSSAEYCQPDGQFRIVVPAYLRDYAQLKKKVVLIGSGTRAKLWDAELLEKTEGMKLTVDNIARMMKAMRG